MNLQKSRGFTLVELSIVILIIGLLAAGILAGQSLIEAGKTRAVITEIEAHFESVKIFREKYFDWPGDITNATDLFPTDAVVANGNGNERVEWDSDAATTDAQEGSQAWYHLQVAQMLQTGGLTGVGGVAVVGRNVPGSKIPSAGYFLDYDTTLMQNYLGFGSGDGGGVSGDPDDSRAEEVASGAGPNDQGIITPKMAYEIDNKVDDGIPNFGKVRGSKGSDPNGIYTSDNCRRTGDTASPLQYDTENSNPSCILRFLMD